MKFVTIGLILFLTYTINWKLGAISTLAALAYIIYSNLAFFYARQGNAAIYDGDTQKGLRFYKKAYDTDRASADIKLTYAILLLRNAMPEEAQTIFNLVIMDKKAKKEIKMKAKQYRALSYFKQGLANEALEEAQEIFDAYKNTVSYGLLGYLKLATNAPLSETMNLCRDAYEYNSDDRDIIDNLTLCCIKNGEFEKAKELADKMLEKFPDFVEGYYHGAIAYKELNNIKKAKELLNTLSSKGKRTYMTTVSVADVSSLLEELNR